jgi:hypothetical protein
MNSNLGEWETESGLIDDCDIWIEDAYFGTATEVSEGYASRAGEAPLLIWRVTSPEHGEFKIGWNLGSGWHIIEGGRSVSHEKDTPTKKKRFVDTSIYGRLLDRCVKVLGLGEKLKARGSPRQASVWKGLGFHMKREELVFPGAADRGILTERGGKTTHLMPIAVLEEREAAAAPSTSAPPDLVARLTGMARDMDFRAFRSAVVAMEGIDDRLMADLMNSSEDGFYARARK